MVRLKPHVSVLLLAALLTGCGAPAMGPLQAGHETKVVDLAVSKNQQANSLIARFKAIKGFGHSAMAERAQLVEALGKTDSDAAAQFLMYEHDNIQKLYPASTQKAFQKAVLEGMVELDDYDPGMDRKRVKEMGGDDLKADDAVQMSVQAHHSRHMGFIRWATEPLRWVDDAIRWFLSLINGGGHHKPKPKPDPGPNPGPGPAPDPGPSAAPAPGPNPGS